MNGKKARMIRNICKHTLGTKTIEDVNLYRRVKRRYKKLPKEFIEVTNE